MESRRGFTLIELMIVIVIIGILASFAIPQFNGMQMRAKEASVKANAHTVQVAAEDFAARNVGTYATDNTSLTPAGETLSDLVPVNLINPFDNTDATPIIWNGGASAPGRVGYDTTGLVGIGYTIDGQGQGGSTVIVLNNDGS